MKNAPYRLTECEDARPAHAAEITTIHNHNDVLPLAILTFMA